MSTLLNYFLRLIRLKVGPQDLPASSALLAVLVILAVLIGTINGVEFLGGAISSLMLNMLDAALFGALIGITLQLSGKSSRFLQTASALFGLNAIFALALLLLDQLLQTLGSNAGGAILQLAVLIWLQVVSGHVLRHALEIRLGAGIMVALSYSVISFLIINQLISI